eukprot:SAG22_NODE_1317_length_4765_cov_2.131590_2_plen_87_part_00
MTRKLATAVMVTTAVLLCAGGGAAQTVDNVIGNQGLDVPEEARHGPPGPAGSIGKTGKAGKGNAQSKYLEHFKIEERVWVRKSVLV